MRESETNPSDILPEAESLEEYDHPQLLCAIPQCRHWTTLDDPNAAAGRCSMENITIGEKTLTICSDGLVRSTAQWPQFVCDGFEWHDQYDRQNATWVAVAELQGRAIDGPTVRDLVRTFELLRRKPPVEDATDERLQEEGE